MNFIWLRPISRAASDRAARSVSRAYRSQGKPTGTQVAGTQTGTQVHVDAYVGFPITCGYLELLRRFEDWSLIADQMAQQPC